MTRLRLTFAALLLPLLAAACSDLPSGTQQQRREPATPRLSMYLGISCTQNTALVVGTSMQCVARTINGSYVQAGWTSSNKAVATVSGGVVTGVAPGSATIYANWTDGLYLYTGSRAVSVVAATPAVVSRVTVTSATIDIGETAQLVARAYDANGNLISGKTATWSIDNAGIATITSAGVVTGQSYGSTTARATIDGVPGAGTVTVQQSQYQDPTCGKYLC